MLTMNSHDVEISIAGYVEEMVCDVEEMVPDPNPRPLFFLFFQFFFLSCVHCF